MLLYCLNFVINCVGTGLVETGMLMIHMVVQTVMRKIVMGKIEAMIGMAVQEVVTGMVVELQHEIKEGALGVPDVVVLMIVQAGMAVPHLTGTDSFISVVYAGVKI